MQDEQDAPAPVFFVGPERDESGKLKRGRWAIMSGDEVVEIRTVDPAGYLPPHIVRDVSGKPDVAERWREVNGEFVAPGATVGA